MVYCYIIYCCIYTKFSNNQMKEPFLVQHSMCFPPSLFPFEKNIMCMSKNSRINVSYTKIQLFP